MDQTYMKEKPVVPLPLRYRNPGHHIDDQPGPPNIVDMSIFVAMISEDAMMTAVSLSIRSRTSRTHPARGWSLALVSNAMVARRLGEGKTRMANQTASQGSIFRKLPYME